ncbi:uncharacterized protein LOC143049474 [Mytilus galloprovincialis]|uniref:uncharacterized protein LOC143049474 n=1 Tax=Mytilus galloprovincialis TaxID=29158 RepID=UPI003F7BAC15
MRKFVTDKGHTWFDVGCSSSQRCSPITSVFGKRNDDKGAIPLTSPTLGINAAQNTSSTMLRSAGDTIVCEKCCSGDICNAGSLCGTAGFLHEMVCFNCSSENEDRCTTIELCDQDEKCFIEKVQNSSTSNHVWNTGCRQKELCQQLQSNTATECLSSCCSSDLCNRKCMRNNIDAICVDKILKCTNKTFQSFVCSEPTLQTVCQKSCGLCHCAPNPCIHGTCTSSQQGYKCTCDAGYTGSICDRVIDHCNPDPCVQGTCYNGPHGYNCSCYANDAGSTCGDCRSNPCIHGTCHDSPNGYDCACDVGFTGYRCDTDNNCDRPSLSNFH